MMARRSMRRELSPHARVPLVDGLLAPPADAADNHVRLRQLVSCEGAFRDAEPLRHLGQAEIPFHASRPAMMAVAASSPADSVHHIFDCLFIVGLMRYGRGRGLRILGIFGAPSFISASSSSCPSRKFRPS